MKKMTLILFGSFVFAFTALADTWTDPDTGITWTYTVSDGEACVGDGNYYSGDIVRRAIPTSTIGAIVIPSTLGGYPLTSIGGTAFYYCRKLSGVTIPNGVTSIGEYAFGYCSGLTSVTIPSSVTTIGRSAFLGCSGLTSVTIPSSVTIIGDYAFSGCSGLTSVTIPSSVTSIGRSAFISCSGLISFAVDAGNPNYKSVDGFLLSKDGKTLIFGRNGSVTIPSSVTNIGRSAFSSYSGLTSVTIPSSVTIIGDYAFSGCSGLTSVTIPSSVTSIGKQAFGDCEGLVSIVIPKGVTSIGEQVFRCCSSLTSIIIPEGVTNIGDYAFEFCSGLTNVVFGGNAPTCGSYAFDGVKNGCTATVYEGTTGWGDGDTWQGLKLVYRTNPVPSLDDGATREQIAVALEGSADAKLAVCITNATNYNAYCTWANKIGPQAVKDSPNAWVSFALGSDKLLESAPTDEDLTVEEFAPTGDAGKFDFTVSVEGVDVGKGVSDNQLEVLKENLKQVFGLDGAATLNPDEFSSDNVDLTFGTPQDGKVKFTAGPKNANSESFFMRVKVKP